MSAAAVDGFLQQALGLHRAGRLQEAVGCYQQVLARAPDHSVANHNLGVIAVQIGDLPAALPYLEHALKVAPDSLEARRSLAGCCYRLGHWEQAQALLDEAAARGLTDPQLERIGQAMRGEPGGAKVFCVGRNKTGTTSMEMALRSLGYRMGLQARGEMLKDDWARRDFTRVVALCRTADAFQDVPFSNAFTFQALDPHFPGSKFVLTVRDSPEQWYESLVRFHTKIVGKGRRPTADDLREFTYRYKGFLWDAFVATYGGDERLLYDRDTYIAHYLDHNRSVTEYFRHRPSDLLVLNVGAADAMRTLCEFLGRPYDGRPMPHVNRTA